MHDDTNKTFKRATPTSMKYIMQSHYNDLDLLVITIRMSSGSDTSLINGALIGHHEIVSDHGKARYKEPKL